MVVQGNAAALLGQLDGCPLITQSCGMFENLSVNLRAILEDSQNLSEEIGFLESILQGEKEKYSI
jgi:hypothetical protein